MFRNPLVRLALVVSVFLGIALLAQPRLLTAQTATLKSPKVVKGYYLQAKMPSVVHNQTGTFVWIVWNGASAESDTVCPLECRPIWSGYRVRRTIEGISTQRLELIGQWKSRDLVGSFCLAPQLPCNVQDFVFTGTGVFFKGFSNNKLPDGSYVIDYPPGNPVDADTTARIFVDLAPIVGFRHEYAVTSIDTLTTVGADFAESPIDSSELVHLTPATPPASNLEHIAVVPNPYKSSAEWDLGPNQREVHFINVPAGATVRIYTSTGELLRVLEQNPNASPGGTTGELAWDLKNDDGRTVVSGIYLYSVHPPDGRTPKKGHFVIIK
jgi:hypothetical protein